MSEIGGSRRGFPSGHLGFMIIDSEDRIIAEVKDNVFFTLKRIP